MRNARAHKLQWSGPTVHSSTVAIASMQAQVQIGDVGRMFFTPQLNS